ncbi:hypothetical protein Vadar_031528 [Vaccinium darrowii]|uniref:Uncharacterized protein n=1 Tax=Vaccinium darrowii TaxID=229202 RepID=A0ACB7YS06_9ERIC|nr:hypothetical protein Vadar_031528 [Vaccinium darrowii]
MTVTQYMARFEELSRHASEYIPTDEQKARQFEWGLDLTIRERVVGLRLRTFAEVVEVALIHEREIMDARKISNQQKMTSGGPIRNNNNRAFVNKKPYDNQPQNQTWKNRNTASGQQQWTSVDQYGNVRICFKCGQEGHIASFCPRASMGNQGSTGYYQHGQGSSSQRSQLPTQQQQFNQQKSAQQPQSGKSWGGKQPQYQNRGKQQPAAGGRMFALQEEEDTDPSAIQDHGFQKLLSIPNLKRKARIYNDLEHGDDLKERNGHDWGVLAW